MLPMKGGLFEMSVANKFLVNMCHCIAECWAYSVGDNLDRSMFIDDNRVAEYDRQVLYFECI